MVSLELLPVWLSHCTPNLSWQQRGTDCTHSPGSGWLDLQCYWWEVSERGQGRGPEVLRAGAESEVAGGSKSEVDNQGGARISWCVR